MRRPSICAVITANDAEGMKKAEPLVDLFEVRIDYIGEGWVSLVTKIKKPWLACNRSASRGGWWQESETKRIEQLLKAAELGASMVDIETGTPNMAETVKRVKAVAECVISHHDWHGTPPFEELKKMVEQQISLGADICKMITTAQKPEDNLTVLRLISEFPRTSVVALAMGGMGLASRILCPLMGGEFTYAAIERGKESAPGQLPVGELRNIYELVGKWSRKSSPAKRSSAG